MRHIKVCIQFNLVIFDKHVLLLNLKIIHWKVRNFRVHPSEFNY